MDRIIIEMEGTPRPFHFGIGFIGGVLNALDIPFEKFKEAIDRNPFTSIPLMMHESHKLACLIDKTECKLTLGDFYQFIDATGGIGGDPVQTFLAGWRESQSKDAPKQDAEKKKRPKTMAGAKP